MDKIARVERKLAQACRSGRTPDALFRGLKNALQADVPSDRWCSLTLDPATCLATGGTHDEGLRPELAPRVMQLEFGADDFNSLRQLGRAPGPVATLEDATGGRPERSARFREVLAVDGIRHEMRAVFRDAAGPWGALILLREGDRAFTKEQVQLVSAVGAQVTRALRRVLLLTEIEVQLTREADTALRAPALLLLRGEHLLEIDHASAGASHWLAQIQDGSSGGLPYALHAVAQRARAVGHAVTRLRTRNGRWITAHAEALEGTVSLIVQPSRPHEVAHVLCGAYGLTAREAETARLVAAGCSNGDIAALLHISRYTVEDHLKSVYQKLDVSSRSELVSRLFFDQYLPRSLAAPGLDGDGWFLGA